MRTLLLVLLCTTGCSSPRNGAPEPTAQAPAEAVPEQLAAKPARLDGIGQCRGPVCTLHFAVQTTGDAETFSIRRCASGDCPAWRGKLTPEAQAKLRALAKHLGKEEFEPGYGCPGCTDGPTHEVVIHRLDGSVSSHMLDPTRPSELPHVLGEASQLIALLSAPLYRCEKSELIEPAPDCAQIMQVEIKRPLGVP